MIEQLYRVYLQWQQEAPDRAMAVLTLFGDGSGRLNEDYPFKVLASWSDIPEGISRIKELTKRGQGQARLRTSIRALIARSEQGKQS